ncbi:M23 family metallopeptidase [Qipengyuania sp. G39]|uniref:M23 family metallopeptidase n=1 Tax=Qipengyuania profundimaris TaxID=3067652 RepID=A0ABT9HL32_9SPHN|nr:M23 family metallopeptidase [Qipengyuania sp. G39]MDP4573826.1 M23 family metallopeptidase [Qipengyuania sp. G39]
MKFARVAPLLLITTACVSQPDPSETVQTAGSTEVVQPVRTPSPTPSPTPSDPARPATFSFDGELTQGGWIRGTAPGGAAKLLLGEEEVTFDEEGRFFAAFDRDAGRSAELVATLADGRTIRSPLAIAPRDWNIERVNVARRAGGASESFMQRRRPELAAIWDARQERTGAEGWRQDFIWPVTGRISGRFGSQRIYRGEPGSYHSGLDIAGGAGTTYVAPADGIVTLAERDFSLEGQLLIIDHGQGLNSAFLHSSELFVRDGQAVKQGQPLGRIGASGRATGPHLHWSIKWKNARLDPLLFLGPMP